MSLLASSLLFFCRPVALAGIHSDNGKDSTTNSLGMKMVLIGPGTFVMGDETGNFDEKPAHQVEISRPFYMSATPVTNAQYEQFDPSHLLLRGKRRLSGDDDEAVIYISWQDAVNFTKWLSKKEGKPYRLPTEAEWEYACRAGTSTLPLIPAIPCR